jgi:Ni,Fe-hydrogenase I cytochrome b subunit
MSGDQQASRPYARQHVNLRLERWHRRCVYASWALLILSGAAWLLARYYLRPVGQFGETIHPMEPWAMKVHGAAAMAMLFFLGTLLNSHIRRALKSGRNLVSGWSMIATVAVLIATGFGLYYLAGEDARPAWSAVHWLVGLGWAALGIVHVLAGRSSAPRQ